MQRFTAGPNERELVMLAVDALGRRLPRTWEVERMTAERQSSSDRTAPDAIITLTAPDGARARVAVEVRRTLGLRDVASVANRLSACRELGTAGLAVARYLSPGVREKLTALGIHYVDATGNIRVAIDSPGLFVVEQGAAGDPWRGPGRRRDSLRGKPAAMVVRALADHIGPWRIRRLIEMSGASTGSVYRVVELLEAEGLVVRDSDGSIMVPDVAGLLRRWAKDYEFQQANAITRWIAPRGLDDVVERLRRSEGSPYTVTGSLAAGAWEAHAPVRTLWVYTSHPEDIAEVAGLRQSESAVNVLLADPEYAVTMERSRNAFDGLRVAAPAQVVVDLMNGPGRAPSEAEELLAWMEKNERSWRLG